MDIANRWADGEDSLRNERDHTPDDDDTDARYPTDSGRRGGRNSDRRRKRKNRGYDEADGTELVAAEFPGNRDGGNRNGGYRDEGYRKQGREWRPRRARDDGQQAQTPVQQLSGPCTLHTYKDENGNLKSSHLLKDCRRFKELQEAYSKIQQTATNQGYPAVPGALAIGAPPPPAFGAPLAAAIQQLQPAQHHVAEAYPAPLGNMCMIQKGRPSNRCQKLITRQVNMAMTSPPAIPEYLNWSEASITFSRADHPPRVPRPGHAALVLEAQIGGYEMSKVFMDGGSGINIIFADTLRGMNRSLTNLAYSETTFHGIVPGKPVLPLGKIALDVIFGKPENFRREKINFEVVDWQSQYHAILGRPTFARFMVVPHYAYLKLKMPGPYGTITIHGSFIRSDNCDKEFNKISESFGMQEELAQLKLSTDHSLLPLTKKAAPELEFNSSNDTRAHQVHPTDAAKTALVSTSLTPA